MTGGVVLLCVAAAAMLATAFSLGTGLALKLGAGRLRRRSATARARLVFGAAVLPLVATTLVMVAALAPAFGWIADHCHVVPDLHGHPHICEHFAGTPPELAVVAISGLFVLRGLAVCGQAVLLWWAAHRTCRRLLETTGGRRFGDAFVLPVEVPQAFVLGLFKPRMFITRGLLSADSRPHLPAIRAHEEAHLRRADVTMRAIASLAAIFHLPGIAQFIERALAREQEMAADDAAARAVGSRSQVAEALIFVARRLTAAPSASHAFAATDLELRVRALLSDELRVDGPRPSTLGLVALALGLAVAASAPVLHHGVELLLGLIVA